MMSTCYSYVCMAVAASLQMGLFTEDSSKDLPEPEKLYRRRIFAVLNIMDTYVTTALGLPRTLRDVESDYLMPSPLRPESAKDPMAGTFAHAELIQILATAVESNHPVTRKISQKNGFYGVKYSKIIATEEQLESWFETLPQNPTDASTPEGVMQMRSVSDGSIHCFCDSQIICIGLSYYCDLLMRMYKWYSIGHFYITL